MRAPHTQAREHGGNIDAAAMRYGMPDMLDLSTGISPIAYPASPITADALQALPTDTALADCLDAAREFYNVPEFLDLVAGSGTQMLLQSAPAMIRAHKRKENEAPPAGSVWIKTPSYNEHAPAWLAAGCNVVDGDALPPEAMFAVIIAPNNPTGEYDPAAIVDCAEALQERGGCLVIDGAFIDNDAGADLFDRLGDNPAVIHLRSFGKFFGMAGLRLGFAIGQPDIIAKFIQHLGPWALSSPALSIGAKALGDRVWAEDHQQWLAAQSARLVRLLGLYNLSILGGTSLFQTIDTEHASRLHHHLATAGIWTRAFADYPRLIRFGLPADDSQWSRLESALMAWSA
ncbi:pyridoxal phosphate-dependent class II aminotransferase [Alphaproteobacteria bacterium]|nr:pyridoxal phosphate-dependent class II aminotransferase [Alphaproteobacteria bacterium]